MKTSAILEGAADGIDKYGWWDGQGPREGRQCAVIAMCATSIYYESAKVALGRALGLEPYGIPRWNDSQSAEIVTSTLRACAAVERARERTEIPPRMLPVVIREAVHA